MTSPGFQHALDRSAAYTALLELSPWFRQTHEPVTSSTITAFLEDFQASGEANMFTYARAWLTSQGREVRTL